jgi:hypothetical protein
LVVYFLNRRRAIAAPARPKAINVREAGSGTSYTSSTTANAGAANSKAAAPSNIACDINLFIDTFLISMPAKIRKQHRIQSKIDATKTNWLNGNGFCAVDSADAQSRVKNTDARRCAK